MTSEKKKQLIKSRNSDANYYVDVIGFVENSLSNLGRLTVSPGHGVHGKEFFWNNFVKGVLPEDYHVIVFNRRKKPVDIKNC